MQERNSAYYFIAWGFCLSTCLRSCARVDVTLYTSAWLTRAHSQHFDMIPYSSPGTSRERYYMMNVVSMRNVPLRSSWGECYLWSWHKTLLVYRSDTTPGDGWVKRIYLIVSRIPSHMQNLFQQAAPARFSTSVQLSWEPWLSMLARTAHVHNICWKSSDGLMTIRTTTWHVWTRIT